MTAVDRLAELDAAASPGPWRSVSDEAGDRGLAMVYDANDLPIGDFSDTPEGWRSGACVQSEAGRDDNAKLAALSHLLLPAYRSLEECATKLEHTASAHANEQWKEAACARKAIKALEEALD